MSTGSPRIVLGIGLLRFGPAHGVPHQGSHIFQLKLLLNVTAVHIDRLRAEVKLLRDIARALALADELGLFIIGIDPPEQP